MECHNARQTHTRRELSVTERERKRERGKGREKDGGEGGVLMNHCNNSKKVAILKKKKTFCSVSS